VVWHVEQFWEIDDSDLGSAVEALTEAGFALDIGKDIDPYAGGPLVEASSDCSAETEDGAVTIEFARASHVLETDARVPATFRFASAVLTR
jgi:hypothetical protein